MLTIIDHDFLNSFVEDSVSWLFHFWQPFFCANNSGLMNAVSKDIRLGFGGFDSNVTYAMVDADIV